MDDVYRHLLVLEEKFLKSINPKKKKNKLISYVDHSSLYFSFYVFVK